MLINDEGQGGVVHLVNMMRGICTPNTKMRRRCFVRVE